MEYAKPVYAMGNYDQRVNTTNFQPNYSQPLCANSGTLMDDNFQRFVGWSTTRGSLEEKFFSPETVKFISNQATAGLRCLREDKRPIIVIDEVIAHAMSSVYTGYFYGKSFEHIGDIYTIFQIPPEEPRDDFKSLVLLTLNFIISQIRDEYQMQVNNEKLTVWTTLLGDFNEHGLRQYSTLRINNKNINKVRFNMNY